MTQLARRIGRMPSTLFNAFYNGPWDSLLGDSIQARSINIPLVNISENEEAYDVSMAVPGFKKEDFKIDVEGNMLIIKSEKQEESQEKNERFSRQEYSYSSFERYFTLPNGINKEKFEAAYKEGILNIEFPKKEKAKTEATKKQIEIK